MQEPQPLTRARLHVRLAFDVGGGESGGRLVVVFEGLGEGGSARQPSRIAWQVVGACCSGGIA